MKTSDLQESIKLISEINEFAKISDDRFSEYSDLIYEKSRRILDLLNHTQFVKPPVSDEEIRKEASQWNPEGFEAQYFEFGAKWMRDKHQSLLTENKNISEYQLCPKCNGDGNLLRYNSPNTYSNTPICDVCKGEKTLIKPIVTEKESVDPVKFAEWIKNEGWMPGGNKSLWNAPKGILCQSTAELLFAYQESLKEKG